MIKLPPLPPRTLPYVPGSPTSQMAAEAAARRAPTQRERIRAFIERRGFEGATLAEIVDALGVVQQSVGPRMRELLAVGRIVRLRITRTTRRGCEAMVLVVPQFVGGRPVAPFIKYELVPITAFDEVFADLPNEQRAERWRLLLEKSKRRREEDL